MKKGLLLFIGTVLFISSQAISQKVKWQKYTSEKGELSCVFPGTPKEEKNEKEGYTTYQASFEFEQDSISFIVTSMIYGTELPDGKDFNEIAKEGFNSSLGAEEKSVTTWKIGGNKGLATMYFVSKLNIYLDYRTVVFGSKMYQVVVAFFDTKDHKKQVKKFFKKFKALD